MKQQRTMVNPIMKMKQIEIQVDLLTQVETQIHLEIQHLQILQDLQTILLEVHRLQMLLPLQTVPTHQELQHI